MKKFNKFYALVLSFMLCIGASIVLSGCKDKDDDKCNLIVFSSVGGYVQVDDLTDYVFNGDEGTKFEYNEDDVVTLKAVAKSGYVFQKWTYATDESEDYNDNYSSVAEIKVALTEDTVILRAVFVLNTSKYAVSWEDGEGYAINPITTLDSDNNISVGKAFSFTITKQENYDYSNMVVKCNGDVLNEESEIYTTDRVYSDIIITVEGVKVSSIYTVTLKSDIKGCYLEYSNGNSSVNYGENISFKVIIDDAYSDSMIQVFANDTKLTPQGLTYTVQNVTENIVINVTGLRKNTYTVTNPTSEDFSVQVAEGYSNTVEYGGSFKFKLVANDAGVDLSNITVEYDGLTVGKDSVDNTYYIINNITTSATIIVRNLGVNTFVVNLPMSDMYNIVPETGYTTIVNYGADFKFKVVLAEGYEASSLVVKYGSQTISKQGDCYVILNITSSDTISITGVSKVTFNFANITTEDYKIEFKTSEVEYGQNLQFEVKSVNDKVDLSEIVVMNGTTELVKGSGYYTITNIKSGDLSINVSNIKDVYDFEIDFTNLENVMFEYDVTYPNEFIIKLERNKTSYNASEIIVIYDEGEMTLEEYLTKLNNNLADCGFENVVSLNVGGTEFITVGTNLTINTEKLTKTAINKIIIEL